MCLLPRLLSLLLFALAANLAGAQSYPTKGVRIIVPFPPGAGVDIVTRAVSGRLAQALGQQLIVDNRTGADGIVGAEVAAKAAPDGYTVFMATAGILSKKQADEMIRLCWTVESLPDAGAIARAAAA